MRVGTLTLHSGYNEGAILQSLALTHAVKDVRPTAEVEIIDHRFPRLVQKAYGPADNGRKQALQAFGDGLPLSPERFVSSGTRQTWDYASGRYAAVLVGSDEVWKVVYRKRFKGLLKLQNDPYAPAFPNIFWPDRSVDAVKIGYAATIGAKTNWLALPTKVKRMMAEALESFKAIGVRDDRTFDFIGRLSPALQQKATLTPDPTFAHPLNRYADQAALRAKFAAHGVDFSRPRLLVIARKDPRCTVALQKFKAAGYQTVALSEANADVDIDLSGAAFDPLEWAAAASLFDACLSERMHGCIFALLNGTPVISLDFRTATMGHQTKNGELYGRTGISAFNVNLSGAATSDIEAACDKVIAGEWPSEMVKGKVADYQRTGTSFLNANLP